MVVDDRLFRPEPVFVPTPTPLVSNDHLIDLLTTPGARPGTPARLDWRPKVSPYRVTSTVRTVATAVFRNALPILGVDGLLADNRTDCRPSTSTACWTSPTTSP
ncbi:hypothetical protein ABZ702_13825 [Streptomyces cyaneofuscatus]|uniref:hypothetical protein n=1 Tax=Streptomyces cyaneofuscatus TaxID=66883 RepID=UPI0033F38A25